MENKTHFAPGIYKAKITRQAFGKSKNDFPQFVLSFELIGKVTSGDDLADCDPWERTSFMTLTQKSVEYVLADLAEIGFDGDSFSKLDPETKDFHDFRGLVIAVTCEHSTYDGVTRERWQIHRERSGIDVKPIGSSEVRKLDAMFGKALKARQPARRQEAVAAPETAGPATNAAEPADVVPDDIPF